METQVEITTLKREELINAVAAVRSEWQDVEEGSLIDVKASVGLLLADLVEALGLTAAEQALALGNDLIVELEEFLAPGRNARANG